MKTLLSFPVMMLQLYYLNFMRPLILQARRKTIPVIVLDDLNKLEHIGMLGEITRFFKLLESRSVNILMISSNE